VRFSETKGSRVLSESSYGPPQSPIYRRKIQELKKLNSQLTQENAELKRKITDSNAAWQTKHLDLKLKYRNLNESYKTTDLARKSELNDAKQKVKKLK